MRADFAARADAGSADFSARADAGSADLLRVETRIPLTLLRASTLKGMRADSVAHAEAGFTDFAGRGGRGSADFAPRVEAGRGCWLTLLRAPKRDGKKRRKASTTAEQGLRRRR